MKTLSYHTLRENVADLVRMKIISNELKPGMRIVEQSLAEEFGISRAPVREALRQLEQEGMVEYVRNVGCSVKQYTQKDIFEAYLLLSNYEILSVRLSGGRFKEEDLRTMETALERMGQLNAGTRQQVIPDDYDFHQVIVELAGLPHLVKTWNELKYGNLISYSYGNFPDQEILARQYRLHTHLLELCRTGDVEDICQAISEHYMTPAKKMLERERQNRGLDFQLPQRLY